VPKYRVTGAVRGGKYMGEYEADTPEEAEIMAMEENGYVSLCHRCSAEVEDPEIVECTVELAEEG
jgi:hypothetical protein